MERPRIPNYDTEKQFDWEYVFELNRFIEWQERQIKICNLRIVSVNEVAFCSCIDRCSSKKAEYWCGAKRPCVHRTK